MKNKIDKILLGSLWLLAVTLGTCFWFNARLGFNIFSSAHWQYLAYLQASQTPVRTSFYTSLIFSVFIAIGGLYLLVRPRFRRIKLQQKTPAAAATQPAQTVSIPAPAPTPQNITPKPAPAPTITQSTPTPATPQHTPSAGARPPRLNIPLGTLSTKPAPQVNIPAPAPAPAATVMEYPEIKEIFTNAGYVLKPSMKIDSVPISLFAIGTNENLWLGGVGIKTTDLRDAMNKLAQIFSDTLDDIYININGFVIAAPDAATSEFQDILMFDSISALRTYMQDVPNPPIPADDAGNFDAYSEYIDTVIDYIDKV